jgi:hypothetical protein
MRSNAREITLGLTMLVVSGAQAASIDVALSPQLSRDTLWIRGEAAVPDGSIIDWEVRHADAFSGPRPRTEELYAHGKAPVALGVFSVPVSVAKWPRGPIQVWVALQPTALGTQQPQEVTRLIGDHGQLLNGTNVVPAGPHRECRRVIAQRTVFFSPPPELGQTALSDSASLSSAVRPGIAEEHLISRDKPPSPQPIKQQPAPAGDEPLSTQLASTDNRLVPKGASIRVRLRESVRLNRRAAGKGLKALVDQDVDAGGGTIIPKGTTASVRVRANADDQSSNARVGLELVSVRLKDREITVPTVPVVPLQGNSKPDTTSRVGQTVKSTASFGAATGTKTGAELGRAVATLTGAAGSGLAATNTHLLSQGYAIRSGSSAVGAVLGRVTGAIIGATVGVAYVTTRALVRRRSEGVVLPAHSELVFTATESISTKSSTEVEVRNEDESTQTGNSSR